MAALNNPIKAQDIVDRFADYVVATANSGIVWATNANPTADTSPVSGVTAIVEIIPDSDLGGTTAGRSIGISGADLGSQGSLITGQTIYNQLVAETNRYGRIRLLRLTFAVTGMGGNNGTRLRNTAQDTSRTEIRIFDQTQIVHGNAAFQLNITIGNSSSQSIATGFTASATNLETFFDNLKNAYLTVRNTQSVANASLCHASCHSSCHSARGRR